MASKYASIDFEYYDTAEASLKLVCASVRYDGSTHNFWLHDGSTTPQLVNLLNKLNNDDYTMLAYNVVAEASSFLSLGLDPLEFKWVDLYLEYRCLSNHNDNYMYGDQLIRGSKRKTKRPKPKWERTEEDDIKADASKQEFGMGAAVYKALGKVIDYGFKVDTRKIIIACNVGTINLGTEKEPDIRNSFEYLEENKKVVMEYCASDVEYLEPMWEAFKGEYKRLLGRRYDINALRNYVYNRSEYACRTAIMERLGYPIRVQETRNFSNQVGNIIWECQRDINEQFESEDQPFFKVDVQCRPLDLSWDQTFTRNYLSKWCKDNNRSWIKTDSGLYSLSLKAFSKHIAYRHTYPRGNFLAQMQRYLKLKQGLNGFTAKGKGKKNFWDAVGKDGRVRPYMGIYTAQSSRSQPSASYFIPLKAAWMRSLIGSQPGKSICGIDWSSQEYLVSALLSQDQNMILAYESGDVYLSFAKDCGAVPQDATKSSHKTERDFMKPIILGQQYDLTEFGLATQLTEATGKEVTPEEAKVWITKHKKLYKDLWRFKKKVQEQYKLKKFLMLPDGWYLWGCNDNFRSVGNVPTQGFSACIMRKAVALAQDKGLKVVFTLHDALYIEFDTKQEADHPKILAECMDEAFRFYFPSDIQNKATCRMEADIWGPDYPEEAKYFDIEYDTPVGKMQMETKQQQIYVDPRAIEDYNKFSKYFYDTDFSQEEF